MTFRYPLLFVWLLAAAPTALVVGPAHAGDRCEGTLCDLYYDHMGTPAPAPAQPAAKAAPTPLAVPSGGLLGRLFSGGATASETQPAAPGAAPAKKPLVAVQGGGLVGMMRGAAPDRCTGTLCDLYYGGPPPEAPAAGPTAAPGVEPVADEPPDAPVPQRRARIVAEPVEPHCSADTRDPWRCYRR